MAMATFLVALHPSGRTLKKACSGLDLTSSVDPACLSSEAERSFCHTPRLCKEGGTVYLGGRRQADSVEIFNNDSRLVNLVSLAVAARSIHRLSKRRQRHQFAGTQLVRKAASSGALTIGASGDSNSRDDWLPLLREVLRVAAPNVGAFFLQLLNEQTNAIMIGRTGNDTAFAAIGLGNMMQNCCGLSIGYGILGALDSLVSQAHGAGQQELACAYFQRGRLIATLQLLWIIPVLCCSERILDMAGQVPDVSRLAASYNRVSAPGLFCYFQFQATAKFLQNQCMSTPPLIINAVCSLFHVAWCGLFVVKLGLGNTGAGYANVATWTSQWLFITIYMLMSSKKLGLSWPSVILFQRQCLSGWGQYLKIAIPSVLQISSEWWFWEVCALVVGFLGTVSLAAHVGAYQLTALLIMPSIGISSAAAALVGNALGAGAARRAKRFVQLTIGTNLVMWSLLAATLYFGQGHLAAIYSRSPAVHKLMQVLIMIYACAGFFDTTQMVMAGALRGMGKMALASAVYILAYWGIMLPLGCVLAFRFGLGVKGIWLAFVLGTSIAVVVFTVALLRTNFGKLASRISEGLKDAHTT